MLTGGWQMVDHYLTELSTFVFDGPWLKTKTHQWSPAVLC